MTASGKPKTPKRVNGSEITLDSIIEAQKEQRAEEKKEAMRTKGKSLVIRVTGVSVDDDATPSFVDAHSLSLIHI